MRPNRLRKLMVIALTSIACLGVSAIARAQRESEEKSIKAEVFIKERPAAQKRNRTEGRYRPVQKTAVDFNAAPAGTGFVQVGVTFWRFRPSTAADKTKELVEDDESGPTEWTLERIDEGTPLLPGQKVRFSIESLTRSGYLYVIDRELYADGTLGDPMLIFPTQKTRDANFVKSGRLTYIPSAEGKFRIKPSDTGKRHVGELVTILVSPQTLVDANQLSTKGIKLPREQVESWEKQWGAKASRFELDGGAGQAMTEKEKAAGANGAPVLTQDDPPPQTVYRLAVKPSDPIILSVPLTFRR
jgi:hypothetical protein